MKNFIRRVVKAFKQLSEAKILTFAQNVTASMAGAVTVFPTPVPALADINDQITAYAGYLQSAASRDKVQVQYKKQAKTELLLMLSLLADYVNFTGQGDAAILAQSGFDLNKIPEPITLKAPSGVTLIDGGNSGELILKFRGVKGAFSYLFQYTSDVTLGSWITIAATTTSYTFTGLSKGTTYYCRAVSVGANQQLMNSIVLSRVSQ